LRLPSSERARGAQRFEFGVAVQASANVSATKVPALTCGPSTFPVRLASPQFVSRAPTLHPDDVGAHFAQHLDTPWRRDRASQM